MDRNQETPKIQPWREHWPQTQAVAGGTTHGFKEGEVVVMDGNALGANPSKNLAPKEDTQAN